MVKTRIVNLKRAGRSIATHRRYIERDGVTADGSPASAYGAQLDAVDHWDTDNPHTHVVLRGKDSDHKDLVIDREYILSMDVKKRALTHGKLAGSSSLEI